MKQTKISKLINALRKRSYLTVEQIVAQFNIPNVYAVINDIRKVHGFTVKRFTTTTGRTAYTIAS